MQRLHDIHSPGSFESNIDIDSSFFKSEIKTSNASKSSLNDLWIWKNTIIFEKKRNIVLSKKRWKCFDSLEQKTPIQKIYQKKDIYILESRNRLSLSSMKSLVIKFFKSLTVRSAWIWFWVFFMFLCLLLFCLKISAESRVNSWYERLLSLKQWGMDISEIQKTVNNARFDFSMANIYFTPFKILPWEKIDSVWHVISWGKYLSLWLDKSLSISHNIWSYLEDKNISSIYFTELFKSLESDLIAIEEDYSKSIFHYKEISWLPSSNVQLILNENLENLEDIHRYISSLNDNFENALNILWDDRRKRYLIVFQNADEIRPTGWFMWSMGLLEIFKWRVQL